MLIGIMDIPSCPRWYVTTILIVIGYVGVWFVSGDLQVWQTQGAILVLGYLFLWCTSGDLVNAVLNWAEHKRDEEAEDGTVNGEECDDRNPTNGTEDDTDVNERDRDVGVIVGKAENILLPTFILAEAYTALALIFAAKGLVRKDDMDNDTLYYLGASMTNITYSIVVGVLIRVALLALEAGELCFLSAP